jgi:integrase
MKITAKSVAAATLPRGKSDIIHFDDELPGFGYRLRQGAGSTVRRSWVVQYRVPGGSRRVLLGAGDVLTAEQARQAAKKILGAVALGQDPQADKAERRDRDRLSLRSVIDDHLAVKRDEVRPGTLREITRYLTGPYFKSLHSRPVDSITRKDVASAVMATQRNHSAGVASLARATLSSFYSWCLTMGYCEQNPVIGSAEPKKGEPRSRVLTDDELRRIWRACEAGRPPEMAEWGTGVDEYGRIIRLLILTACRRTEVGGMRWSELDSVASTWTIPKERAKNNRAHVVPLMPVMIEIIRAVPRMVDRDQLFGSRSNKGFSAWSEGKDALDARIGFDDWRVHDIRRSVATKMADIGIAPHIIEALLNHVSGHKSGVHGVYNRSSYEREKVVALATWSDHLNSLIGGKRKIVPLRKMR